MKALLAICYMLDQNLNPSNYVRYEYQLEESDKIDIFICGDSVAYHSTQTIPAHFSKMKKIEPSDNVVTVGGGVIDSISVVDYEKLNAYYQDSSDFVQFDSIYTETDLLDHFDDYKLFYALRKTVYKHGVKHGKETFYYPLSEIKGRCIKSNFRIKSECDWKKGQKHGKWIEYNKEGEVVTVKVFKHDQQVKLKVTNPNTK